jgi:hypothetical protein
MAPGRLPVLRRYQSRVFQALMRGIERERAVTFTVLLPRQAGKNEVAANVVAALLFGNAARGGSVIVCAPSLAPQAAISMARVEAALGHALPYLPRAAAPRTSGATITVGRASVTFLSASPQAHVAGHTASLALIADEAQEIDTDWFERQFRPMAASTGAPTVLFGTPWDGTTLLDRAVAANRAHDARAGQGGSRRHFEVGWEEVARSLPAYGDYVRAERERLGAEHPLFRTQYGLETTSAAGRLFTPDDLAALDGGHPRLRLPRAGERYVAGLDLAGAGADATVLTVARVVGRRCEVVEHLAWADAPFAELREAVVAAAQRWGIARLAADATGMGAPFAEALRGTLGDVVEPVVFTAASKSALGFALLAAARDGSLALYADDGSAEARTCRAELSALAVQPGPADALRWGAPAGAHDDYAVSLALCLQAARGLPPPRVAVGRRG